MIYIEISRRKPAAERAPRRPSAQACYWLIAKTENNRITVLTLERDGEEEVLPVFGHEEEAEMFLWIEGVGDGWRPWSTTARELVSVLYGRCMGVKEVTLDALLERVAETTTCSTRRTESPAKGVRAGKSA